MLGQSVPLSLRDESGGAYTTLTGTATFSDGSTTLALRPTAVLYIYGLQSRLGSHSLTAVYSGVRKRRFDSNTITIQSIRSQTISFSSLSNVTFGVSPFTVSATAALPATLLLHVRDDGSAQPRERTARQWL